MSRITKYICDACEAGIEESDIDRYYTIIDAPNYNVHLHTECFKSLTPLRLISILNLDDIYYQREPLIHIEDFK